MCWPAEESLTLVAHATKQCKRPQYAPRAFLRTKRPVSRGVLSSVRATPMAYAAAFHEGDHDRPLRQHPPETR